MYMQYHSFTCVTQATRMPDVTKGCQEGHSNKSTRSSCVSGALPLSVASPMFLAHSVINVIIAHFHLVSSRWMCTLGMCVQHADERWGAGVETQKNVRGEIGGWGRVPFNETYAPSLSTIYDGA